MRRSSRSPGRLWAMLGVSTRGSEGRIPSRTAAANRRLATAGHHVRRGCDAGQVGPWTDLVIRTRALGTVTADRGWPRPVDEPCTQLGSRYRQMSYADGRRRDRGVNAYTKGPFRVTVELSIMRGQVMTPTTTACSRQSPTLRARSPRRQTRTLGRARSDQLPVDARATSSHVAHSAPRPRIAARHRAFAAPDCVWDVRHGTYRLGLTASTTLLVVLLLIALGASSAEGAAGPDLRVSPLTLSKSSTQAGGALKVSVSVAQLRCSRDARAPAALHRQHGRPQGRQDRVVAGPSAREADTTVHACRSCAV